MRTIPSSRASPSTAAAGCVGGRRAAAGKSGATATIEIESQSVERVLNEDVADQRNTILKMAFKRSHVAAALGIGFVSEIFTQDLDDMRDYHPDDGEGYTVEPAAPAQQPVPQASRPEPQPARQTRRPAPAKAQGGDDRGPELSQMEIDNLLRVCTANGVDPKSVKYIIQDHFGLDSWKKLDKAQYDELVQQVIPARGNAPAEGKQPELAPVPDMADNHEAMLESQADDAAAALRPKRTCRSVTAPHRTNRQTTAYPSRESEEQCLSVERKWSRPRTVRRSDTGGRSPTEAPPVTSAALHGASTSASSRPCGRAGTRARPCRGNQRSTGRGQGTRSTSGMAPRSVTRADRPTGTSPR